MTFRGWVFVLVLALVLAGPAAVRAQTPAPQPDFGPEQMEWIASGFVGPVWGQDVDGAQVAVGGSVGALWDQSIGAEFAVGVVPGFEFSNPSPIDASLSTWMANAIWALPMEPDGRLRPFVTGGIGLMRFAGDADFMGSIEDFGETQLSADIGIGAMYFFEERWGARTDLRYVWGFADDDDEGVAVLDPEDALADINFLRWTVGVTYRW